MNFDWDEKKNLENIEKHGISFEDSQIAFLDSNRIITIDKKHSKEENRYFCFGKIENKICTVRFTYRNETIRIIGAGYWRQGKKKYEEENNL